MRAFPTLPRIIPAFAARECRSTTCGLPLSAYGTPRQPCVNAIRHPDACVPGNAAVAATAASSSLISRAASISRGGFIGVGILAQGEVGLEKDMGLASFMTEVLCEFNGATLEGSMSEGRGRLAGQLLLFYSRS
ncbi:hypothetical protein ALC56_00699 [Trachymyrmex septentrionalis]|uniref:Uncharacterized protein n=1 Tax=Trachymyrmex septentrionalis TaxID=34720 RepID=A0A195FXZ2_9HYME|nr:hypothetical protein ALC56_00699 [Trachymyrmex septentrionalis]